MTAGIAKAACWTLAATLTACRVDFERMDDQQKVEPYEASRFFADGRAMRDPPRGTVPLGRTPDSMETRGVEDGRYAERIPIPLTRKSLQRGRERYDIFCAPCHGVRGDGDTKVAEHMRLRKPPSLIDGEVRDELPGQKFQVISEGFGLMRSYADQLSVTDRWAIVGYLEALARSQQAPLDALPADVRARAIEALR